MFCKVRYELRGGRVLVAFSSAGALHDLARQGRILRVLSGGAVRRRLSAVGAGLWLAMAGRNRRLRRRCSPFDLLPTAQYSRRRREDHTPARAFVNGIPDTGNLINEGTFPLEFSNTARALFGVPETTNAAL